MKRIEHNGYVYLTEWRERKNGDMYFLYKKITGYEVRELLLQMTSPRRIVIATNDPKYKDLIPPLPEAEAVEGKSRCCGRCDGVHDICVGDQVCDAHSETGCEICFGLRRKPNPAPLGLMERMAEQLKFDKFHISYGLKKLNNNDKFILKNIHDLLTEYESTKK